MRIVFKICNPPEAQDLLVVQANVAKICGHLGVDDVD